MRLPIASANRASIVLMAVLLASCSNTSPGSQALPLGSPGAEPLAHRPGGSVDVAVQYAYVANFQFRQRLRFRDCGRRRVDAGWGLAV